MNTRAKILLLGCATCAVGLLYLVYLLIPGYIPNRERTPATRATSALQTINTGIWQAALEDAQSLEEAILRMRDVHVELRWTVSAGSNGIVHLNPDWSKWMATSTNSPLFKSEIAAYCTPGMVNSNGMFRFFAMTFDCELVELRQQPEGFVH